MTATTDQILEQLKTLSLLEASELVKQIEEAFGVSAAATAGVVVAAAGGGAAAEVVEEKTEFDVILESFDAASKIKVIKEVRAVTNLGLKEAKDLVESAPCTLMAKVKKEDAAKIAEKLRSETGAEVEIV